jgi:WD40 repeat protein
MNPIFCNPTFFLDNIFIAGSRGGRIFLYDLRVSVRSLHSTSSARGSITAVKFLSSSFSFLSLANSGNLNQWDIRKLSSKYQMFPTCHNDVKVGVSIFDHSSSIALCEDLGCFATASRGNIGIWDLKTGNCLNVIKSTVQNPQVNPSVSYCPNTQVRAHGAKAQKIYLPGLFYSYPGSEGVYFFEFGH